ncbi:MAG: hypothetical protein B7O98_08395 [Zestosphaera tikiterensis]|uniref:Uncharacterized protein n=1 Tax=Zestosphaera tikiterensis TaxID=1973259 RepID=A0A2R7Y315_9CREN|nr:MAG: hypothetical protein B7O98_08395 [Zestosphaera tikiterensis]
MAEVNGLWDSYDNRTVTYLMSLWDQGLKYYLSAGSDVHDIWSSPYIGVPFSIHSFLIRFRDLHRNDGSADNSDLLPALKGGGLPSGGSLVWRYIFFIHLRAGPPAHYPYPPSGTWGYGISNQSSTFREPQAFMWEALYRLYIRFS